jgi:hexosaminidase
MRFTKLLLVAAVAVSASGAEHNRLLPRPQRITYGDGRLPTEGLAIDFAAPPTPEDRFVAKQLAPRLAAGSGDAATGRVLKLIREGDGAALPQNDESAGPGSREWYRVRVTTGGAEIRARSSAGLFYGAQTLLQMVEGTGRDASLPAVEIEDWPGLAYRGVMMDLSHGGLPTVGEIEHQIDFMAQFKANQYYFYSELSVELKGYSLVNPGARYSREEVLHLIDYARERHVDVVPCLEFYGHLHDLFRLERYAGLAALAHSGEINPRDPKVLPMMRDWIDQLTSLFPSPWFHFGLDEPWELERAGRTAGVDPARLYFDHLEALTAMVQQHGKRPMFWAEVSTAAGAGLFTRYPERLTHLPKGLIAMTWDYSVRQDYSPMVAPLAKLHVPTVVATAVKAYEDISPDFEKTFANIDGLLADCRKFDILGTVNTDWSDDAQLFFRATLPGIAYGAAAAWQSVPMDRSRFYSDYAERLYPPAAAPEMAAALKSLGNAQTDVAGVLGDHTFQRMWQDPLYEPRLERLQARAELLRKTRLDAEDAQEHLERALALSGDTYTIPSLLVSAKLLDYTGMRFLYALEIADIFSRKLPPHPSREELEFWIFNNTSSYDHARLVDLMDAVTGLKQEYRSAWLDEYGPYRLGTILGRFDAEYEYWRRLQSNLQDLQDGFKDKDAVPPLETFRPWGLKR